MAKAKAKKPAVKDWILDAGFYSYEIRVTARTKGEARRKAMAKLKRTPVTKYLNRHTTFLDKES